MALTYFDGNGLLDTTNHSRKPSARVASSHWRVGLPVTTHCPFVRRAGEGATIKAGERVTLTLDPKRHAYLVPPTGVVNVGSARIGAAITDLSTVEIVGIEDAEVVIVDAA
ncbi:MAG: hypothetical protein ABSC06_05680 [Rhodopila sp.]